ncbi:ATP-binding cassette domain-containing protein [Neorhizobium sp. JUb45]|uniref:ABC transporter ATP-binding protein n=1 Tax=Neorhizobium sp. JUb45 TaxID=2485113 RepID=UPI0010E8E3FC|nr:ATP-binding cassette domain-containing protein [Neorhizobium sp. JUb45]TCQ99081.1 peptide/nickel transport system ATP-binding protein [Neorhizobium sp. JUb45]
MTTASSLLSAQGVSVSFNGARGRVDAVRDVSLDIQPGEVLAVIGESGSGKSTLARALLGMVPMRSGQLHLDGEHLAADTRRRTLAQKRRIGMIFQDSAAAFNPRFTIERILLEPFTLMTSGKDPHKAQRPAELLDKVRLSSDFLSRYPHELSGGQRQRVGIARALAGDPDLLICDEAVSALDVSVQAQILNLLSDLQEEGGLSLLFITHDLSVVEYLADRVAVMFRGELLETGSLSEVFDAPKTDYTHRLLQAVPRLDDFAGDLVGIAPEPLGRS